MGRRTGAYQGGGRSTGSGITNHAITDRNKSGRRNDFSAIRKFSIFRYTVKRTGTESHIEGGLTVAAAPVETVTIEISTDGKNYTNQGSITDKAGRWVGVKSGVYASHENTIKKSSDKCGFVTVDYVRYSN